jgi:hypothetical protein
MVVQESVHTVEVLVVERRQHTVLTVQLDQVDLLSVETTIEWAAGTTVGRTLGNQASYGSEEDQLVQGHLL